VGIDPCACTPPTPGIVTFNPAEFIQYYPAFASVPAAALTMNFNQACLQLNNSCCSVVRDAPTRAILLHLLTAHITALINGVNGQPPQGVVGRISSATEGSVSVQAEYPSSDNEAQAYYAQTPWGAQFWRSTAVYRTARYVTAAGPGSAFADAWEAWPE
jgi:hypothetical protein